jgi:hypothetical protein
MLSRDRQHPAPDETNSARYEISLFEGKLKINIASRDVGDN